MSKQTPDLASLPPQVKRKVSELNNWLKKNPDWIEPPASIAEFLGPDYLNIESSVRRRVKRELIHIFGRKAHTDRVASVSKAILTGSIGWGKSFTAAISIC